MEIWPPHTGKSLVELFPLELLQRVFSFVKYPEQFVLTCKRINEIGKDPSTRVLWLCCRYGKKRALLASSERRNVGLIRGPDVGLETFRLLIKMYPGIIPRCTIQAVFQRLVKLEAPHALAEIVLYGTKHYDVLALHSNDFELYRKLLTKTPIARSKALKIVKNLIEKYHLDPVWSHWSVHDQSDLNCSRLLGEAVDIGNLDLVLYLLNRGVPAFDQDKLPTPSPDIRTIHQMLTNNFGPYSGSFDENMHWKKFFIDYRESFAPITYDIIYSATYNQEQRMLDVLLQNTPERWGTEWGQCVLCCCIQYAFDQNWETGLDLLFLYFNAIPRHEFRRSQLSLRRELERACRFLETERVIPQIIQNGIIFTDEDTMYGGILCMIIREYEKPEILTAILDNYSFSEDQMRKLLRECRRREKLEFARVVIWYAKKFDSLSSFVSEVEQWIDDCLSESDYSEPPFDYY